MISRSATQAAAPNGQQDFPTLVFREVVQRRKIIQCLCKSSLVRSGTKAKWHLAGVSTYVSFDV
ncbi:hypothetical protein M404DRAFT_1005570, partial [Pisolithus tinctorius Marx 270]